MSFSFASAASSSPGSLSLAASAQLHAQWAWRGLVDGARYPILLSSGLEDNELRANIVQSALLNTLALVFLHGFGHVFGFAGGDAEWHGAAANVYHVLWSLPLISASLYLNSIFCARTAKRAFTLVHGTRGYIDTTPSAGGLFAQFQTSAPRWIMLGTSVGLDLALRYIPIVGPVLAFFFLCWVDAYYFFEFVLTARGMPLAQRVQHLEERWAYHLAFGFPSAVLLTVANSNALSNATLFALIFPVHIILATHARPRPSDPHNLDSASADSPDALASFLPLRLPVFAPVIWIDTLVMSLLLRGEARTTYATSHQSSISSTGPRAAFTRVARSPIVARSGGVVGRTTFGGMDADSMEAGSIDADSPWGGGRKLD